MIKVKVLECPAIDVADKRRDPDGVLFPEFKSREFLETRRRVMTTASWEAIYQQNPITRVGVEFFPLISLPSCRSRTGTVF